MIGFEFTERMTGCWHRVEAPVDEQSIEIAGRAHISSLRRGAIAVLRGRVVAAGLTTGAAFEGTLGLGAILRERRVPYAFSFRGDDGRTYRFDGAKEVALGDLRRTLNSLPGYLFDDAGEEVGRVVLRGEARDDWHAVLRSWRVCFGRPEDR